MNVLFLEKVPVVSYEKKTSFKFCDMMDKDFLLLEGGLGASSIQQEPRALICTTGLLLTATVAATEESLE